MSKDHYVPRHYLRQFAVAGSELIAVANVAPYRYRGIKGIGGECQETDFEEGNLALSNTLKMLENKTAPTLAAVVKKEDYTLVDFDDLRWFAATLNLRTKKAAESYKVLPTHMCHEFLNTEIASGRLPPPPEGLTKDIIDWGGVPSFLMRQAIPCAMHMQNLALKLLKPPSNSFFITSDNPVVLLNQYSEGKSQHHYAGLGRAGIQVLLPFAPHLCGLFYDAKVYKVGSPKHRLLEVDAIDAELINSLQIQSACDSVYFHSANLENQIASLVTRYSQYRVPLEEWLRILPGRNDNEELWHFRTPAGRLPKPWRCCRVRRHVSLQVGQLRDPLGSALISALMDDIEASPNGGDLHTRFQRIIDDPGKLKGVRIQQ